MKNLFTFLFLTTSLCVAHAQSSIEFAIGTNYTYRSISTNDSTFDFLIESRNETEKPQVNLTYNLLINRQIAKNWYLQSGIKWVNLGYFVTEIDDLIFGSEISSGGVYTPDPTLPKKLELSEDIVFLEIPLNARYIWPNPNDKKLSFYVQAGLSPNVYLTTRSIQILDDRDKTITSQKNNFFRTLHLSTQVAAGLTYRMNKRWAVFTQASFKHHITAIADTPVKEYLHAAGIDMGLRWYLK